MSTRQYVTNCLSRLSDIFEFAAGVIIFSVSTVVMFNVIVRALFKTPLLGTTEIVQYFVLTAVSFALPKCTLDENHTRVTFLVDMLPYRAKRLSLVLMDILSVAILSPIAWNLWTQVMFYFSGARTTDILKIPYYIILGIITIPIILMILTIILRVIAKLSDR